MQFNKSAQRRRPSAAPGLQRSALKMQVTHVLALLTLSLLAPFAALAQPSPDKLALAEELVRLLRVEQSVAGYLEQCAKPEGSPFDPMVSFRSDPGSFGGISPQSAYWPEVKAVYARFQTTACAYATPERLTRHFVEKLATDVSENDLRVVISFNRSGPGMRVQDAVLAANSSFQPFATKLMYEAYEIATKDFQQQLRELARKYRRDPK